MNTPRPRSPLPAEMPGPIPAPQGSSQDLYLLWCSLDRPTQLLISKYHARFRLANQKATEAWNRRQDRLVFLQRYADRNAHNFSEKTARDKVEGDWEFNDANDDLIRWTREAARCKDFIDVEIMMARMRDPR